LALEKKEAIRSELIRKIEFELELKREKEKCKETSSTL
jgi:hypothetical protein